MTTSKEKKKVLFVSGELIGVAVAVKLQEEGCDVRLFIKSKKDKECLDGIIPKTKNWQHSLKWVGKDGLIIFDDVGYGKIQDKLRSHGYNVVGGSSEGDKLEQDRVYAQNILFKLGVINDKDFRTHNVSLDGAIKYIRKHKGKWVIKQNDHNNCLNYVSQIEDGSDAISVLEHYKESKQTKHTSISIQKKVDGVEIAAGRFFNGKDWIGPIVVNKEHKHIFENKTGPLGGESGTLMWYESNDNIKLFKETLDKLKPLLQKANHIGYIDINFIISSSNTIYPLEVTSRFGSSTTETQCELHLSSWWDFLSALAKGENFDLKYKSDYAVTAAVTVPPFPYVLPASYKGQKNVEIFFQNNLTKQEFKHVYLNGVKKTSSSKKYKYLIASNDGYVLYVSYSSSKIEEARKKLYKIIQKIHTPKMFYRSDIAISFFSDERSKLKKWGWI